MQKLFHRDEREPSDGIRNIAEEIRARPMSKLSDKFFTEQVTRIKGKLVYFNDELFPSLSAVKDDIAKELSLFVDWSGKNAEFDAKRLLGHGRSFSFNRVLVDKEGRVWKYINVKGGGVSRKNILDATEPIVKGEELHEAQGLFDIEGALTDKDFSLMLLKQGDKTAAPFIIIQIEEVLTKNGERKSIVDLKKEGKLSENILYDTGVSSYRPVLYIRLFSEVMRLDDASKVNYENFAKEHEMSLKGYKRWWVARAAKNLAGIHNLGKYHGYISEHNLTIDGCIVDYDSIKDFPYPDTFFSDFHNLIDLACRYLPDLKDSERKDLAVLLLEKYFEGRKNLTERELRYMQAEFKQLFSYVTEIPGVYAELARMTAMEIDKRFGEKHN
jgi:hypothetical protein